MAVRHLCSCAADFLSYDEFAIRVKDGIETSFRFNPCITYANEIRTNVFPIAVISDGFPFDILESAIGRFHCGLRFFDLCEDAKGFVSLAFDGLLVYLIESCLVAPARSEADVCFKRQCTWRTCRGIFAKSSALPGSIILIHSANLSLVHLLRGKDSYSSCSSYSSIKSEIIFRVSFVINSSSPKRVSAWPLRLPDEAPQPLRAGA